jgi:hypothetical protein
MALVLALSPETLWSGGQDPGLLSIDYPVVAAELCDPAILASIRARLATLGFDTLTALPCRARRDPFLSRQNQKDRAVTHPSPSASPVPAIAAEPSTTQPRRFANQLCVGEPEPWHIGHATSCSVDTAPSVLVVSISILQRWIR